MIRLIHCYLPTHDELVEASTAEIKDKKSRPMADQAALTFNTLTEHDVYRQRLLSRRRKYLLNLRDGRDDLRRL